MATTRLTKWGNSLAVRRPIALAALFSLATGVACAAQSEKGATPSFEPAHVVHVVDPEHSAASIAYGVVILKVAVSPSGTVDGIDVANAAPSLTEEAERTVKAWKFEPARFHGEPIKSWITVSFAYSISFSLRPPWVAEPQPEKPLGFQPIQILSAIEAPFPITSVANPLVPVSVILQVTVGESGSVDHIEVIHAMPTLTESAEQTIKMWKFQPATIDNKPVSSVMIASFTFRHPWADVPPNR